MKKRLGIFVFYDEQGVVDRYVKWLLEDLKANITDLIIAINGEVRPDGYQYFKSIAQEVIIRKNQGLDGGAYADVICDFLGQARLERYEEVVFSNDTYYGPFVSFQHIFKKMEDVTTDFWGLSYLDMGVLSLVDAYFFVVKERVIKSGDLYSFFKSIQGKITDYNEACIHFEVGILSYLRARNYKFSTYMPPRVINIYYELLLDKNIDFKSKSDPVVKKKCFSDGALSNAQSLYLLNRIQKNSDYRIEMILENVARLYGRYFDAEQIDSATDFEIPQKIYFDGSNVSYDELVAFLTENHNVYIYGAGLFGQLIYVLFKNFNMNLRGFVVSDGQKKADSCYGYPIRYYSEVKQSDAAFLVSLSTKASQEIKPYLDGRNTLYFFQIKQQIP